MAKKRGLLIFWVFLVIFTFLVLSIGISYFYFEMNKLQMYGVTPFADVKSYAASILKMVPFIGNSVKYEPLRVIPYQTLLESRINAFQNVLNTREASLEAKEIQIASLQAQLASLQATLKASQTAFERQVQQFNAQVAEYQSYQKRIQTLDQWITNSNPSQIGRIIATSNIPINVIVDAMVNLSPQVAGSVLQAISQTNPAMASSIIENLTKVTR
ncbi:OmpH family outer membrane protein [Athalassotoga saccharophila]|uniref:hypothetical protein n=1 Tax=Athalassotoga saccharophila TaxID=1441386 RepID=UPI00137B2DFB|nr:hypothetical protein [Athalassotoga saccharophila]BBJ27560.1 hypothetical protein ATHSA_0436 [Athalassotoga saccharophila]